MSSFSSPDEDEPEDPDMTICWSSFPLFAHMKRFLSAKEVRCSYWYIPCYCLSVNRIYSFIPRLEHHILEVTRLLSWPKFEEEHLESKAENLLFLRK